MEYLETCSIPVIALLCYGFIEVLKRANKDNQKIKDTYPFISALLGTVLGIIAFLTDPDLMVTDSLLSSALAGMASGLSATGSNEVLKRVKKGRTISAEAELPARFYITGGMRENFEKVKEFCENNYLSCRDTIIFLGNTDPGQSDECDEIQKTKLNALNTTLFFLQDRIQKRQHCGIRSFCGGIVYFEPKYPNILYAKNGEVYTFDGKDYIAIGNLGNVEKDCGKENSCMHQEYDVPDAETKASVEQTLVKRKHQIGGFLTYACPKTYSSAELLDTNAKVAESAHASAQGAAVWLDDLMRNNQYDHWYCGCHQVDKTIDKISFLHKNIILLNDMQEDET